MVSREALARLSPRLLRRLEVLEDKRERQKITDDFCNVFKHLIWVRCIPSPTPQGGGGVVWNLSPS
jgi:hypothetical protein